MEIRDAVPTSRVEGGEIDCVPEHDHGRDEETAGGVGVGRGEGEGGGEEGFTTDAYRNLSSESGNLYRRPRG